MRAGFYLHLHLHLHSHSNTAQKATATFGPSATAGDADVGAPSYCPNNRMMIGNDEYPLFCKIQREQDDSRRQEGARGARTYSC